MADKIRIRQAVLVEGRSDKIALEQLLDARIFTTEGFGIFHNTEKKALLRRIAETEGILLLTDSDGGGKQIRAYLAGILPAEGLTHLYIPQVAGKERRKAHSSKAGYLGVEGTDPEILRGIFAPFATDAPVREKKTYTKLDLYERGLLGGEGAKEKREALCRRLGLPPLSSNALLAAVNLLGESIDPV